MCEEVSRCYTDVNICLWTNKSWVFKPAAQSICQQRNSFLPRITNSNIQSKLRQFRSAASHLLLYHGFWIDVRAAVAINDFHWIDGSSLAGHLSTRISCIIVSKIQYENNKPVGDRFARSYLYATSMFSCFHA